MPDYIEREALITFLKRVGRFLKCEEDHKRLTRLVGKIIDHIENEPSADVAPVVHGRWEWREKWDVDIPNHNSMLDYCGWYCSHCGIELGEYMTKNTNEKLYYDDDFCKPALNCCPHCGAKMDLEGGEG